MNDAISSVEEDTSDDWSAALAEQAATESPGATAPVEEDLAPGQNYPAAQLENLDSEGAPRAEEPNIESILEIPVSLSMEVGRTRVSIRNLLQLTQGSVVELERLAGEPLDVMVNGTLIAHGEVVVVNDKFGIRVTDVISAQERIRKLK